MTKQEYSELSTGLLKLWIENLLTDGEYYKIIDRLNERYLVENETARGNKTVERIMERTAGR